MSQLAEIPTGTILAYIFFFKWHVKSAYFDVTDRRHYQTKEQEQEKTRTFSKAQVLQLNIKDYTLLVPFIQWTVKFAICIAQILICALGGLYWQEADRVCDVWIYWVSNRRGDINTILFQESSNEELFLHWWTRCSMFMFNLVGYHFSIYLSIVLALELHSIWCESSNATIKSTFISLRNFKTM